VSAALAVSVASFEVPFPPVLLGAIIGMTYGLLAVGLVLVYRTNRIINFAHGEVGAFAAAVLSVLVGRWHVPYYLAVPVVLAVAGAVAAVAEAAVVRRLRSAPPLMSIVATLGVGQVLLLLALVIAPAGSAGFAFPSPPGLPEFDVGPLRLTQAYTGMILGAPLVVAGLTIFLRRSRIGLAMRCAAANPEAARMSGIFSSRMSSLAWAIAGALSAFTALLVIPASSIVGADSFGPNLLLRALACAVVARMVNLPVAFGAGVALGVVEQVLLWNYPQSGLVELVLFLVILVALLAQRGVGGREGEKGSWAAAQGWKPLPEHLARLPEVRLAPWVLGATAVALALLLPLVTSNASVVILTQIIAYAIVGLSVAVVTGLGGQLSLGQFAVAGVGAVMSFHVSSRVGSFPLALLYAGMAGAAASVAIGLPALRIRGLLLTVTTLAFSLVALNWLLGQPWMFGAGVAPGRPIVLGNPLETSKEYYLFALAVLMVVLLVCHNVRRGGLGRRLVAVRDNEDNARAFTVPARAVKLQGFALAGFIAGVGGATFGHLLPSLSASAFPIRASIDVVAMTVVGGMSLLVGPLLGALYIVGVPAFLPLDAAGLAATQLGWLLLVLYLPGGVAQGLEPLRNRFVAWAARRNDIDPLVSDEPATASSEQEGSTPSTLMERLVEVVPGTADRHRQAGILLQARGLRKSFGGVHAVQGVDLHVRAGEIVGLIGPNGAGKTTTFELLGGFTEPDDGVVRFDGEDISRLGPEARAGRGLIRSFQDAALFPTMTVLDVARLAFERVSPTRVHESVLGLRANERDKDRRARDLIGAMGLDGYRHRQIRELSTGTRRLTEIACLLAAEPRLLLLDEPSSGVAQRETEALGALLADLRRDLGITMLVIEHDIPLIMGLSDRIVAMESGSVIAAGRPEVVRADPRVVEAYLGGSIEAIDRSTGRSSAPSGARRPPRVKEPA